jgi:hypothetical protein
VIISSRTPEGTPNRCPVCGQAVRIEPSASTRDAPCPHCGSLLWFKPPSRRLLARPSPSRVAKLASFASLFVLMGWLVLATQRSGLEVLIVAILALLLFGRRLVTAGRHLGKAARTKEP